MLSGRDDGRLRRVGDDDSAPRRCFDVDIVDTDAGATDHLQPIGAVDQICREPRRRAHDDGVVAADDLLERALGIDIHVEPRAEKVQRILVTCLPSKLVPPGSCPGTGQSGVACSRPGTSNVAALAQRRIQTKRLAYYPYAGHGPGTVRFATDKSSAGTMPRVMSAAIPRAASFGRGIAQRKKIPTLQPMP